MSHATFAALRCEPPMAASRPGGGDTGAARALTTPSTRTREIRSTTEAFMATTLAPRPPFGQRLSSCVPVGHHRDCADFERVPGQGPYRERRADRTCSIERWGSRVASARDARGSNSSRLSCHSMFALKIRLESGVKAFLLYRDRSRCGRRFGAAHRFRISRDR